MMQETIRHMKATVESNVDCTTDIGDVLHKLGDHRFLIRSEYIKFKRSFNFTKKNFWKIKHNFMRSPKQQIIKFKGQNENILLNIKSYVFFKKQA